MGLIRLSAAVSLTAISLAPLSAQAPPDVLTAAQTALACGPPPSVEPPAPNAPRILGAQDSSPRTLLGPQDLLVIGGGTQAGLQLGQKYFIRRAAGANIGRPADAYGYMGHRGRPINVTAGWVRIVALNETTSIAMVDHACDAIFQNDYLEPFEAPSVPAAADRQDSTDELDFTSLARVVAGRENRHIAAPGDYVVIDRGSDHGLAAGERLAIYRDVRIPGMPLAALGEAVVMSSGRNTAVIRINRAGHAVMTGDYLVPRK
jgi:hypothetical protein